MSFPWIMTEFLINTPTMKENVFFPMDIYNDAAHRALQYVSSLRPPYFFSCSVSAVLKLTCVL
jgi:hypothetical protein